MTVAVFCEFVSFLFAFLTFYFWILWKEILESFLFYLRLLCLTWILKTSFIFLVWLENYSWNNCPFMKSQKGPNEPSPLILYQDDKIEKKSTFIVKSDYSLCSLISRKTSQLYIIKIDKQNRISWKIHKWPPKQKTTKCLSRDLNHINLQFSIDSFWKVHLFPF